MTQSDHGRDERFDPASPDQIRWLQGRLTRSEAVIADLEALLERQFGLLERYAAVASERPPPSAGEQERLARALDRALDLLDQAIAGGEARARENGELERKLQRALDLLDHSVAMREQATPADGGPQSLPSDIEQTLARYDAMLERSMEALETAFRECEAHKEEIAERDRLLARTLDLLQTSVDCAADRRPSLLERLFS